MSFARQNSAFRVWLAAIGGTLPAFLVILILFCGGLFLAATESLGFVFGANDKLTFAHLASLWRDREIRAAIGFTLYVTTISTIISAIIGTAFAVWLRKRFAGSLVLKTLLQFPLGIPHLVVALLLLNFLARSGFFARLFFAFGAIANPQEFWVLVNDNYGIGIILAYVLKESPFVALFVLTILARDGAEFEAVAENLGASRWQQFRFVTLPIIAPAVTFSSLIVWAFIFGAFEIPLLLGRSYPAMLAVNVQRKFGGSNFTDRPEALALAIVMTAISLLFAWLYLKFAEKGDGANSAHF